MAQIGLLWSQNMAQTLYTVRGYRIILVLSDGKLMRMISSLHNKKMKANVFQYATDVPFDVPDLPIQNNIRYIPKVFQSEQVINVDAESVQSLAFVFKFVDFEKVAFTESQGMQNVYLLCGCYNQRNGVTQIRDDIAFSGPLVVLGWMV
jgi:hypothetical protein